MPSPTPRTGILSHFLKRKKRQDGLYDSPPPPPPKDKAGVHSTDQSYSLHISALAPNVTTPHHVHSISQDIPRRMRATSLSDYAILSRSLSSDSVVLEISPSHSPQRSSGHRQGPQFRPKWTPAEVSVILDPEEKARRRIEAQKRREMEEEDAIREEAERQARLKFEKEEILRQEKEEHERRRAILEEDLRQASAERARKEEEMRELDERKRKELEEKRKRDKVRRLEESRRLEEWRQDQARQVEEHARRKEELKRQAEEEKRARIQLVEATVSSNSESESLLTGWVTMQTNESLVWKRRFYRVIRETIMFYRSPQVCFLPLLDIIPAYKHIGHRPSYRQG